MNFGGYQKHKNRKYLVIDLAALVIILGVFLILPVFNSGGVNSNLIYGYANKFAGSCKVDFFWRNCYSKKFLGLTKATDAAFSLKVLQTLEDIDPQTRECHVIAHGIGNGQVSKDPAHWENYLASLNPSDCMGGFIHGAIEGYTSYNPNFTLDASSIERLCDLNRGDKGFCYHIFGHLITVDKVGNFGQSVGVCESLMGGNNAYACDSGVFMESLYQTNLQAHGLGTPPAFGQDLAAKQQQFCRDNPGRAGIACWQELAHLYVYLSGGNLQALYSYCGRASVDAAKNNCYFHGIGLVFGGKKYIESGSMSLACGFFKGDDFSSCLSAVVKPMLYSSIKNLGLVNDFCQTGDVEAKIALCKNIVKNVLAEVPKSPPMQAVF